VKLLRRSGDLGAQYFSFKVKLALLRIYCRNNFKSKKLRKLDSHVEVLYPNGLLEAGRQEISSRIFGRSFDS